MFILIYYFISINVPAVSSFKINCAEKSTGESKTENTTKHKIKISLTKGKRLAFINPNYTLRSWKNN